MCFVESRDMLHAARAQNFHAWIPIQNLRNHQHMNMSKNPIETTILALPQVRSQARQKIAVANVTAKSWPEYGKADRVLP